MSDAFVDFVPNVGKMAVGGNSFADFQILEEPKVEPVVEKKKAKVKLSKEDLQVIKEMEAETVAENGGVAVAPVENEVGQPPEGGNGEPPIEVAEEVKEKPVKNRKSGRRQAGRR